MRPAQQDAVLPRKRFILGGAILVFAPAIAALGVDWHVRQSVRGLLHDDLATLPAHHAALVLGTSPALDGGRPNPYFHERIEAAARLIRSGKAEHLLVSGDNGDPRYNEPMRMREALLALGVDSGRITMDFAGFDTFDSVVRAREVFGLRGYIIVSQRTHNERALYIARHFGIEAVAYNAGERYGGIRGWIREKAAKMKMVAEFLVGAEPRYLGEPVTLGKQQVP